MASIRKRTINWTTEVGELRATNKYQADYYDRSGKRHRRMFDLKKDAQRWLDEQTAGLVTGQWADPRAGRETVRAYGERWLKRQVVADSTAAMYGSILTNHVYPTLANMRMDAVNRADIQSLVKEWQMAAAPSTVEGPLLGPGDHAPSRSEGPGHPGHAVRGHQPPEDPGQGCARAD